MPPPLIIHQPQLPDQPTRPFHTPPPLIPRAQARPIANQTAATYDQTNPSSFGSQVSAMSDISNSLRPSPPLMTSTSTATTPDTLRTPAATASSSTHPQMAATSPTSPIDGLVRVKSFPHSGDLLGNPNEASGSRRSSTLLRSDEDTVMANGAEEVAQNRYAAGSNSAQVGPPDDHAGQPQRSAFSPFRDARDDLTSADTMPYRQPVEPRARSTAPWQFYHDAPPPPFVMPSYPQPLDTVTMPTARHAVVPSASDSRSNVPDDALSMNELGPFRPWLEGSTFRQHGALDVEAPMFDGDSTSYAPYSPSNSSHPVAAGTLRPPERRFAAPVPIDSSRRQQPQASSSSSSYARPNISAMNSLPAPATHLTQNTSPGTLERRIDSIEARYDRVRQRNSRGSPTSSEGFPAYDHHRPRPYDLPSPTSRARPAAQGSNEQVRRSSASRPAVRPPWLEAPSVPPPRAPSMFPFDPHPFSRIILDSSSTSSGGALRAMLSRYDDDSATEPRPAAVSSVPPLSPHANAPVRSARLQERLAMLDAIRSDPHQLDSPRTEWRNQPIERFADYPLNTGGGSSYGAGPSIYGNDGPAAVASSSRATDGADNGPSVPRNVIRPSSRRWISFDEGSRGEGRGDQSGQPDHSIGQWNQEVNDAIGRRLSQFRPSEATTTRRQREPSGPDWEDTQVGGSNNTRERIARPAQPPRIASPAFGRDLYGDLATMVGAIPDTVDHPRAADRANDLVSMLRARRYVDLPGFDDVLPNWDLEDLSPANAFVPAALGRYTRFEAADLMGDGLMDIQDPTAMYAYIRSLRGGVSPPSSVTQLKITSGMSTEEAAKVVQSLVKGMNRIPSSTRRKGADSVVQHMAWGSFEESQDMEKDEICAVCHDEYFDKSEIVVTPCKHMYHKDCLDSWHKNPNTSSCPMCRRDLAVLAFLTNMVPSKKREEAMPLWLAA